MSARIRTAAKLNWDLRVLGRRPDGYHELRSWFLAAGLWDELEAGPRAGAASSPDHAASTLELSGPAAAGVPADGANLVLRAEAAWRAAFPERARALPPLRWRLTKSIPHGAGLGGGSGNAAGALRLLERLAQPAAPAAADSPPPVAALAAVARGLGSDVDFFLQHQGGAELRGGRGELLLARAPLPAPWCVVALPEFGLATAAVYGALRAGPVPDAQASPAAPPPSARPAPQPGPNDLAAAAALVEPALISWSDRLRQSAPFLMTGSGSACFAPCADAASAARLAAAVAPFCRIALALPALDSPALATPHTP